MKFFFKIVLILTLTQSSSYAMSHDYNVDYHQYELKIIEHFEPQNCPEWKKVIISHPWLLEQGIGGVLGAIFGAFSVEHSDLRLLNFVGVGLLAAFGMQIKDHPDKKNWLNTQILLARCFAHEEFQKCIENEISKDLNAQIKIENNNKKKNRKK